MGDARRVAVALGSGGARGYAHIGVLDEIEARGWRVAGVAGTSMGALVGGLHAAGGLAAYRDWVTSLTRRDVLRLMDPVLGGPGVLRAHKIMAEVRAILGDVAIEDLPVPYTAVATDLMTQSEVWFTSGPLDEAIRASIAIPTVFTPVATGNRLLADGGLLNPVPVIPLAGVRADAVVAVNLGGTRRARPRPDPESARPLARLPRLRPAGQVLDAGVVGMLTGRRRGTRLERTDPRPPAEAAPPSALGAREQRLQAELGTLDVVDRSLQTMQNAVLRYRLASHPPDVLVTVPADACGTLDFHRATEMIELGRRLARQAFDRWGAAED